MIAVAARSWPHEDAYMLRSQIVRASRSVTANIAEGFGRHHHQENIQFCRLARGSLAEALDHLNVAADEGLLASEAYTDLRQAVADTWRVLNGYIAYLGRCARQGVPDPNNLTT